MAEIPVSVLLTRSANCVTILVIAGFGTGGGGFGAEAEAGAPESTAC